MNKMILQLKGFPKNLLSTEWETSHIQSPAKLQRLAIDIHTGNTSAFCFNEQGILIDRVLDDESVKIKDMFAIDFPTYMAKVLADGMTPVVAPFIYVYNIGGELANTTNFADKLLTNLVKTNSARGNTTILVSDTLAPSLFSRNYPSVSSILETKTQIARM